MKKIGTVTTEFRTWDVYWNASTKELTVGGQAAGTADTEKSAMWKANLYAADPLKYKG